MEREEAEELRRRLYAPGASPGDVERFRTAEPSTAIADPDPDPEPEPPKGRPSARRRILGAVVLMALVAAAVVGIGIARITTAAQDAIPAPTRVSMAPEDVQEIEENFAAGNDAGIAAFLLTHRQPPALQHITRADTIEAAGTGDGVAQVFPAAAETFEGRATVLLVLAKTGEGGWSVFRGAIESSGAEQLVLQQQRRGLQVAGVLTTDTFRYGKGDRPVEVQVQAPAGVRWGVAVVLSD